MQHLGKADIEETLKRYPVEFVVANLGVPPKWIPYDSCYEFWKTEGAAHCAISPEEFCLEDYPGEYVYVASEWVGEIQTPIILLEMHH